MYHLQSHYPKISTFNVVYFLPVLHIYIHFLRKFRCLYLWFHYPKISTFNVVYYFLPVLHIYIYTFSKKIQMLISVVLNLLNLASWLFFMLVNIL